MTAPAPPTDPPTPMEHTEKARLRMAAYFAGRLYPGPVGELLSRELYTWEEFGYRLGDGKLIMRLVHFIEKQWQAHLDERTYG